MKPLMRVAAPVLLVAIGALAKAQTLEEVLAKVKAPGVSVFAAKGDKVIVEEAAGYANLEHKVKMRPDSVHELASVSKQFTAAAILLLAQEGKINLDDPLSKFFSDSHDDWKKVTVLHLLHHTAGLPDYLTELKDLTKEWSNNEMIASIKDKPLEFAPDSRWAYSNSGYMVLGVLVEKISGQSARAFYRERFWEPLGMKRTYLNDSRAIIDDRADGYDQGRFGLQREEYTSRSLSAAGDGHVMSTTRDLWTWCRALHEGKVLNAEYLKKMLTPAQASLKESDGQKHGYACGLVTTERSDGVTFYSHEGGWAGTATYMVYNPQNQVFFSAMANKSGTDKNPYADYLAKKVQEN